MSFPYCPFSTLLISHPHAPNAQPPNPLALLSDPAEKQRNTHEQQPLLQILQNISGGSDELLCCTTQQLLPGRG